MAEITHILVMLHGTRMNIEAFRSQLEGMQDHGRVREVKLFDVSVPREREKEFIEKLTEGGTEHYARLKPIRRIIQIAARLLGYQPLTVPYRPETEALRYNRLVHCVVIGSKPDRKNKGIEAV